MIFKRTYFISYATKHWFDNAVVTIDGQIKGMDDIKKMEKIIKDAKKLAHVKIINFDLMPYAQLK